MTFNWVIETYVRRLARLFDGEGMFKSRDLVTAQARAKYVLSIKYTKPKLHTVWTVTIVRDNMIQLCKEAKCRGCGKIGHILKARSNPLNHGIQPHTTAQQCSTDRCELHQSTTTSRGSLHTVSLTHLASPFNYKHWWSGINGSKHRRSMFWQKLAGAD